MQTLQTWMEFFSVKDVFFCIASLSLYLFIFGIVLLYYSNWHFIVGMHIICFCISFCWNEGSSFYFIIHWLSWNIPFQICSKILNNMKSKWYAKKTIYTLGFFPCMVRFLSFVGRLEYKHFLWSSVGYLNKVAPVITVLICSFSKERDYHHLGFLFIRWVHFFLVSKGKLHQLKNFSHLIISVYYLS